MDIQTVKHETFEREKWGRKMLLKLRKTGFRKKFYRSELVFEQIVKRAAVPKKALDELVDHPSVALENFLTRNGNVSPYELLALSSLAKARGAKRLLEIGTFDGNTTYQLALNTPKDAIIHTIDLPEGEVQTRQPVLDSDLQFIYDEKKEERKFQGTSVESKIVQHFGDSTRYNFQKFCEEGKPDFIFIDGGHSYQCVCSDTFNALEILEEGGCILWHDFTPLFGGVFHFLKELSKDLPLIHIEGTHLIYYTKENA